LDDDTQRLVLQHIQSGARTVCPTLAAATEWIRNFSTATNAGGDSQAEPIRGAPDTDREGGCASSRVAARTDLAHEPE
jgi:hypothetical protein